MTVGSYLQPTVSKGPFEEVQWCHQLCKDSGEKHSRSGKVRKEASVARGGKKWGWAGQGWLGKAEVEKQAKLEL